MLGNSSLGNDVSEIQRLRDIENTISSLDSSVRMLETEIMNLTKAIKDNSNK